MRLRRLLLTFVLLLSLSAWAFSETRVLIAYDSIDGHTEELAHWLAQGVQNEPETILRLKKVQETTQDDLLWADVILVGSPVYNAGLTQGVGAFLAEWPFEGSPLKNRVGAAFVSARGASAGSENAMFDILKTMMIFRMLVIGGEDWRSGFGVTYVLDGANPTTIGFVELQAKNLAARACRLARCTMEMRGR